MTKLFAALAAVSLLAVAPAAFAGEPVQLTAQQMDTVTAGGASGALVNLSAIATGGFAAATETTGFAFSFQHAVHNSPLMLGIVFAGGSSVSSN